MLNSIELPAAAGADGVTNVVPLAPLPGSTAAEKGTPVTWEVMAWNAQMAGMFANGGPRSTQGSAMAPNGLNLAIVRQGDTSKMRADLVKNAADLANNPQTPGLVVSIMGMACPLSPPCRRS